jgi:hypothetical protein
MVLVDAAKGPLFHSSWYILLISWEVLNGQLSGVWNIPRMIIPDSIAGSGTYVSASSKLTLSSKVCKEHGGGAKHQQLENAAYIRRCI